MQPLLDNLTAPGVNLKTYVGMNCFPSITLHTIMRSRNEELTEEPTITWATGVPSTSETF